MISLQFHSPVEQIYDPLFTEKEVEVFIKRDDLIHPFISGNKWRKLKYLLQSARSQNKEHLVTFGGAWSNHLLATACAAAKFGFKSTGFVRGEQVTNPLLAMCRLFGMDLKFTDRESYRDKHKLFENHFAGLAGSFFIDEGGASAEAVRGCSELVAELEREYDHLFCACGTGTTAAGIINGLTQISSNTLFHGVPVLKGGEFLKKDISDHLIGEGNFQLHTDYHFGGYAKTSSDLIQFVKKFSSSMGILLDPIYTGKLFFGIYDLIKKGYFKSGSSILAVHTGGIFGLLGKLDDFDASVG